MPWDLQVIMGISGLLAHFSLGLHRRVRVLPSMPLAPCTIVAEQYLIHRIDGTNQYGLQWDVQHSLAQAYVLYILYSLFKAMHYYTI